MPVRCSGTPSGIVMHPYVHARDMHANCVRFDAKIGRHRAIDLKLPLSTKACPVSHNVSRPCIDIDAWSASYKTEALTRGTKGKGDGVSASSLAYAIFSTYMLDNYQTRSQSETRNRFVYLSFPSLSYSNVFKCLREERSTFRCQKPTPRRFTLSTPSSI